MAGAPEAKAVGEEFLARQREMYASGDLAAVEELLAEDVVWHVPGTSPIAGDYRGRQVFSRWTRCSAMRRFGDCAAQLACNRASLVSSRQDFR